MKNVFSMKEENNQAYTSNYVFPAEIIQVRKF